MIVYNKQLMEFCNRINELNACASDVYVSCADSDSLRIMVNYRGGSSRIEYKVSFIDSETVVTYEAESGECISRDHDVSSIIQTLNKIISDVNSLSGIMDAIACRYTLGYAARFKVDGTYTSPLSAAIVSRYGKIYIFKYNDFLIINDNMKDETKELMSNPDLINSIKDTLLKLLTQ